MTPSTLPDYLCSNLRVVSVGLNPSIRSAEQGVYFVNPRNRFWRALQGAGLINGAPTPAKRVAFDLTRLDSHLFAALLRERVLGFTDVVKRPTKGARDLVTKDFRRWVPVLEAKLLAFRPRVAWFHGKVACGQYLKFSSSLALTKPATGTVSVRWGRQPWRIGSAEVFVTPNPSSANAAYSLDQLVQWYAKLAELAR